MIPPDQLVPPHLLGLRTYEPGLSAEHVKEHFGLERVAKLASNENPLGTSPKAIECAQKALSAMHRYPDGGLALRQRLAERFNMKVENVITGSGSEGIMANVVRTFLCDEDEVLTTDAAFGGFQVLAKGRGVAYRTVPYRDWHYDLCALADAITTKTKLIYLANPNNPTGTYFTRDEFEDFYGSVPERVLIILDEAYFEFAAAQPTCPDSLHYRFDNVITLRTFSKVYGLAAARIGYGCAHESLIAMLLKVKLPFEPSGLATAAALGALEDDAFLRATLENNAAGLSYLTRALRNLGVKVVPPAANFMMLEFQNAEESRQIFDGLLRRGVIVRPLASTGLPQCLRVSVGTPDENRMLVENLESIMSELEVQEYATTR
ncbi:MAG TPA: histidinol-phosphate transaminase [Bryobacteraceae bacterium]|nr:histidinol-phosphate transaminase [Bryobacteraceae bacterium]